MKAKQLWIPILMIFLLLPAIASAVENVGITFDNQDPSDIGTDNVFSNLVNISYNFTGAETDNETRLLYFKTNFSSEDCRYYINGTQYCNYTTEHDFNITNGNMTSFFLDDNDIYPATYNYEPDWFENTTHTYLQLNNTNQYIKIELLNVSNTKQYGIFEVMANFSDPTPNNRIRVRYCNSSLTKRPKKDFCTYLPDIPAGNTYNHSHGSQASHHASIFAVNTTTGRVNNQIYVTPVSYFIIEGYAVNNVRVYGIEKLSRTTANEYTTNKGSTWTSMGAYTIDSHLHQYDATETLYYYASVNGTNGTNVVSAERSDTFDLADEPPSAVDITTPSNTTYYIRRDIAVNFSEAISPNGYNISYYNISLLNSDESFNSTIVENNSVWTNYTWDTSAIDNNTYSLRVEAFDINGLSSYSYSDSFNLSDAVNLSTPVIPQGYYTENHTITVSSRIHDADGDGLRANITLNTSSGDIQTQYISSIASFENDNANGWTVTSGGILSSSALESEGNYVYYIAYNDGGSAYSLSKSVNLSNYDSMIFDYRILDYEFYVQLNTTTIFTSIDENEEGATSVNNVYINLSDYGGISTLEFGRNIIPNCLLAPWSCSNTKAHIDNIRFGAYFDNEEYNITSNTNVTALFNLQPGTGVTAQDLLDVSNNFTTIFNVTDSTGNSSLDFSNLMNISNRKPTIENVTLNPILETQNAALLSYDFTDPDDGHTNETQFCRWYMNDTLVYDGGECTLDKNNYTKNSILVAEVKATDSYNYSDYVNSTNLTVGDNVNPDMENISIPTSGVAGDQQTIIIDCSDTLSSIETVTINITDADNQKSTYTMDYYTGSSYRLFYTPGKAGEYYFTGARCIDSSYNENVTTFNYQMSIRAIATGGGGDTGGGGGGDDTIIETEVIIQKPENESLFILRSITGTTRADILIMPNQTRKLPLKLISQHDKEIMVKLYCSDETIKNLCKYIILPEKSIKLKPSATERIDVNISIPPELSYGNTGKVNIVGKLVVAGSTGRIAESDEISVVRTQITVSRIALVLKWAVNLISTWDLYGVPIYKGLIFLTLGGLSIFLGKLLSKKTIVPFLFFMIFFLGSSIMEFALLT